MENKLSKIICGHLLTAKIISNDYLEVYIYGMEILLSFLISTTIILTIVLISGRVLNTIIFLAIFMILRRFTGGFHADTYLICKIFTVGTYLTVLLLSEFIQLETFFYLILTIPGIPVVYLCSPIENPNKPLTDDEKKKHKFTSVVLYFVIMLIGICIQVISRTLSSVICYTLTSVIALMILSILKKGTSKNEETSC